MPKIIVTEQEVRLGVERYAEKVREEGADIDISDVAYDELVRDINDEYACGIDGSAYDVICDLADSVGLSEYGIHIS